MTDLLLQPTGNPTQFDVIADGHIVGQIALFTASQVGTLALVEFHEGRHPAHGFAPTRDAAMQAFPRCWHRETSAAKKTPPC